MTGDAQAGAAVFAKRCAVCHRLRGVGHEVGPNLASLTDYSPQALLTAMLDPNRAVEAKFLDYVAVTTGGLTYTGHAGQRNRQQRHAAWARRASSRRFCGPSWKRCKPPASR